MSVILSRIPGESPFEHHKRLVYGKLYDKSLAEVDYSELATPIYGKPYSSDVARRMMYGSFKTLQLLEDAGVSPCVVDADTAEKVAELRKERQKYFDQRREYHKLLTLKARSENLEKALIEAANNLNDTVGSMYDGVLLRETSGLPYSEAILVFCDWHLGMTTDNVWNTYNVEICKERVRRVVDSAIERILLHSCDTLHIVALGDMVHGAIHTSARVASEELICDQIMQASEILAQSITELSQFVRNTKVYVTYGNHARTVQNKKDSVHRDNMERIIPWWLKQRLCGFDNIEVMPEEETEFVFINSCGHEFCASHGDLDTVRTSPRLLATLFQKKYGKDIDYILLADKHHRESFEELGVTAMICGALCGADDYANDKRLFSTPEQLLLIVNEKDGLDAEYRLKC